MKTTLLERELKWLKPSPALGRRLRTGQATRREVEDCLSACPVVSETDLLHVGKGNPASGYVVAEIDGGTASPFASSRGSGLGINRKRSFAVDSAQVGKMRRESVWT